tara:strand:+ start:141 stop:266 length:126 start_codon:yes stop_codon:yes gene_type:complete
MMKKILITEATYKHLTKEAKKRQLTSDELNEIIIKRELKIK